MLRVHPTGDWMPAWYAGLLAGVIVLAVVVALLTFAVLVSRCVAAAYMGECLLGSRP